MDQRFDQHGSPNAIYHVGGVLDFIFGLEIVPNDVHEAEQMILAKLTELGFFWPIVTETGDRTQETFAFTEKESPSHPRRRMRSALRIRATYEESSRRPPW
ncbi:hypothetical protein P3T76_001866 [Phytophthora citrophthora]|uniref:Uncharacterized protein n=1 Tax=Phytophthora citrophthora TaxID=4793 RepID=A0AAD9LQT1_9STRA|nr:hypothetical protein P3T76_001866 [Phytophthora citrophthora]